MVVYDFDVLGSRRRPAETHAILIIDANTVLTSSLSFQGFKPVPRRHSKVGQLTGDLQLPEFASGDRLDTRKPLDAASPGEGFSVPVTERHDHETC